MLLEKNIGPKFFIKLTTDLNMESMENAKMLTVKDKNIIYGKTTMLHSFANDLSSRGEVGIKESVTSSEFSILKESSSNGTNSRNPKVSTFLSVSNSNTTAPATGVKGAMETRYANAK